MYNLEISLRTLKGGTLMAKKPKPCVIEPTVFDNDGRVIFTGVEKPRKDNCTYSEIPKGIPHPDSAVER